MQRYIQRPLLLNGGCKFHIRVYVLAVGNLRADLWSEMLALIAVDEYDRDAPSNRAAHITNTCANAAHPRFDEAAHVRLLSEVLAPHQVESVVGQMRDTVRDLFAALHSEPTVFLAIPSGFELFGFDFLVDEQMGVWFLEANAGPDFAMTGDRLHPIVNGMMEHTFRIAVDPFFEKACAQAGTPLPPPAAPAPDDKMQGSFIPCYDVVNNTKLSMSFF